MAPASVPQFLPALAELARLQHFVHAANLHETIWKQLPVIAENVGKKVGGGWRGRQGGGMHGHVPLLCATASAQVQGGTPVSSMPLLLVTPLSWPPTARSPGT